MKASLRIALACFSFVGLQFWLNLVFGAALLVALLVGLQQEPARGLSGWTVLGVVSAIFIAVVPAVAGGAAMRAASTPSLLHLRPHGRLSMLAGATIAITLIAVLVSSPLLLGIHGLTGPARLSNPLLGTFQFVWGCVALVWVWTFCMSRQPLTFMLSYLMLPVFAKVVGVATDRWTISADQVVTSCLVAGVVAWLAFSWWYACVASVRNLGWMAGFVTGRAPALDELATSGPRGTTADTPVARPRAFAQYLSGTESVLAQVGIGAIVTLFLVVLGFVMEKRRNGALWDLNLLFFMIFSAAFAPMIVRRARLVWLKAGMRREELFREAELRCLLAQFAVLSVPIVVFIPLSQFRTASPLWPLLLLAATQLAAATCFLYTGLTLTRRWRMDSFIAYVVVGLLLIVVNVALQPEHGRPLREYFAAIAMFSALAFALRAYARRAWLKLDWRLTGPPLPTQGLRSS